MGALRGGPGVFGALVVAALVGLGADATDKVRELLDAGQYDQAATAARALLADVERTSGPDSPEAADALDLLGTAIGQGGRLVSPESQTIAERILSILEKIYGPDDPRVAGALHNLGFVRNRLGDTPGARAFDERALAIMEKTEAPDSPALILYETTLALRLISLGDPNAARPLLERAQSAAEKRGGADDPDLLNVAEARASLESEVGDYEAAQRYQRRVVESLERTRGPDQYDTARALGNLAIYSFYGGDYDSARAMYERALAILEKTRGAESREVALTLGNLGRLLVSSGDYQGARLVVERALAIQEKVAGSMHPSVATSLSVLADVRLKTGDLSGAIDDARRALAIREKASGPDSLDVASSLSDLAVFLQESGDLDASGPLLLRALAIREKALGPDHPDVGINLINLGIQDSRRHDFAASRASFQRAIPILEKALGPDHPILADALENLGQMELDAGHPETAMQPIERDVAIREQLGADHPLVASALELQARLRLAQNKPAEAISDALRSEEIGRAHFRLTASTLPEVRALEYAAVRRSGLNVALTALPQVRGSTTRIWDAVVRSRALVLDEMASRRRSLARVGDTEASALQRDLQTKSARFANLLVRGPTLDAPETYRRQVEEARGEKEQAERAIAESTAAFRRGEEPSRAGLEDVARSLPADGVLVAYVRYDRVIPVLAPANVAAGDATGASATFAPSYMAFIMRPGHPVAAVTIGDASEVDDLVSHWAREAAHGTREFAAADPIASYREAAQRLRRKIWDPLALRLPSSGRLFVVPDGALQLVNFAALPAGRNRFLVEDGPLIYLLSSERDLLPGEPLPTGPQTLLAIGGPAYDAPSAAPAPPPAEVRGAPSTCRAFEELRFAPLPASAVEAREIADVWRGTANSDRRDTDEVVLTGGGASESAFKKLAPGRRVLHLATHGFFLGGRCRSALDSPAPGAASGSSSAGGENPLALSGLVLAGANNRNTTAPGEDDGVLTAEEVAALDLSDAEWAVLSACDTGTGEVKASEGVLGLRRAFQVAGARFLVMSLWAVEDEATRSWMRALYQARWQQGMSSAAAVRAASRKVLADRRAAGQSVHPFYWGAFVGTGIVGQSASSAGKQ